MLANASVAELLPVSPEGLSSKELVTPQVLSVLNKPDDWNAALFLIYAGFVRVN
jgi:hypothetical protein